MKKIAVYGSLLSGLGNHGLLSRGEATLITTETIKIPYGMISYSAFPALVPSNIVHDIVVEIYEVDDKTYRNIESLEGYPSYYQKAVVPTSIGDVEIYVRNNEKLYEEQPKEIKVTSGSWKDVKKERILNYY